MREEKVLIDHPELADKILKTNVQVGTVLTIIYRKGDRGSVSEARGEPHRGPEGALQQLGPEGELRAGRDTGAVSSSSSSSSSADS